MIIVRLKGGLGNQMFQYAAGRALSVHHTTKLKLDNSFFRLDLPSVTKRSYSLDVFTGTAETVKESEIPFLFRLYNNKFLIYIVSVIKKCIPMRGHEKGFGFNKDFFLLGPSTYLDGYWQSYKYFSHIEDMIRKDFILRNTVPDEIKKMEDEIRAKNSLCIHVRRGDYVGNKIHEVVDTEYYAKGIDSIKKRTSIDHIYLFSDDIQWCKDNLTFDISTTYVGEEYAGENAECHLLLMSACNHFIIPNSTFSWWGAWLSTNKDKIVVCPSKWFNDTSVNTNDLIPDNWLRI